MSKREDPRPETLPQRVKRLRLERDLSQRELACPGVSYAYISRIEAGTRQPSVKALRKLAAKLGVSTEYLETGVEPDKHVFVIVRLCEGSTELVAVLTDPVEAEEWAAVAEDAENAYEDGVLPPIHTRNVLYSVVTCLPDDQDLLATYARENLASKVPWKIGRPEPAPA